jgi:hypothetical protein
MQFNGIKLLPPHLYNSLFNNIKSSGSNTAATNISRAILQKTNLIKPNIFFSPGQPPTALNKLSLPPLLGSNMISHTDRIASLEYAKHHSLCISLASSKAPPRPVKWLMNPGWTRYDSVSPPHSIPYPTDRALVFDVEGSIALFIFTSYCKGGNVSSHGSRCVS